jgi:peptide subunit release factor RF-3
VEWLKVWALCSNPTTTKKKKKKKKTGQWKSMEKQKGDRIQGNSLQFQPGPPGGKEKGEDTTTR